MIRTTSLNGGQTQPLTKHSLAKLAELAFRPQPRQAVNAGVADRLEREALVEVVDHPSPYAIHRGKPISFLRITEAGHAALAKAAAS